jgi:hypothetical protein
MGIGFNADALNTNLQLGVVADLDALAELLGLPATNAAASHTLHADDGVQLIADGVQRAADDVQFIADDVQFIADDVQFIADDVQFIADDVQFIAGMRHGHTADGRAMRHAAAQPTGRLIQQRPQRGCLM